MRTSVATIAINAEIIPETAYYQRGVLEETKKKQSVSSSINVVHSENMKPRVNHLLHNFRYLQDRENNLNDKKRKTSCK